MFRPDVSGPISTGSGMDTNHDGLGDTVSLADPTRVLLLVDTDGDELADELVSLAPHGVLTSIPLTPDLDPLAQLCTAPAPDDWP
ncbi:MAG TPA: hypothetical protein VGM60_09950 [Pseudonocardia sp.]|jgi:hypothetical protein|uniref:hypothetical protein n=1 Tax=Pseudonocardia sp. TaxID=60912 RepID=UPI002F3EB082